MIGSIERGLAASHEAPPRAGDDARRRHPRPRRSQSAHNGIRRRSAGACPERRPLPRRRRVSILSLDQQRRDLRAARGRVLYAAGHAPHSRRRTRTERKGAVSRASRRSGSRQRVRRTPECQTSFLITTMPRFRTAAAASLLVVPIVAGGFLLQEPPVRANALLFDQVMSLVRSQYVDTLPPARPTKRRRAASFAS